MKFTPTSVFCLVLSFTFLVPAYVSALEPASTVGTSAGAPSTSRCLELKKDLEYNTQDVFTTTEVKDLQVFLKSENYFPQNQLVFLETLH